MGRLTQLIEYLNTDKHPSKDDIISNYTHINITDELKRIRRKYRRLIKKNYKLDE